MKLKLRQNKLDRFSSLSKSTMQPLKDQNFQNTKITDGNKDIGKMRSKMRVAQGKSKALSPFNQTIPDIFIP